MKRFLVQIALFGVIIVSLVCALTLLSKPDQESYTYVYNYKVQRLDTLSAPRLIFIGGSNVAFNINSPMISDSLNVNVQNMGVHASIGLKFMLDDLENFIRPGDEIVIMPEWSQFGDAFNGREQMVDVVLYRGTECLSSLNYLQWISFITNMPTKIRAKAMKFIMEPVMKPEGFFYSPRGFNHLGDEVSHYKYKGTKVVVTPKTDKPNNSVYKYLAEKIGEFENRGCTIHLYPPACITSEYELNKEYIDEVLLGIEQYNIPFDIPVQNHVFADSLAFDSPYHLGKIAVDSLGLILIQELREHRF